MTPDGPADYPLAARERWLAEPPKRQDRSDFARDRARVVHSSALRRLSDKTQVVGPGSDDFVRNRLTHTLEVAQIGRELGAALGADAEVVDTACLAHDLGHPPFGHNGETALDAAAADIGGFEGNAQTLRLLTRLEAKTFHADGRPAGLNLTRATLDAATKYPWDRGTDARKYGVYADDAPVFAWLREGAPQGRRCLEAQVMDWADDVAYSVHDVEDGLALGVVDLAALRDADQRSAVAALTRSSYAADVEEAELAAALDRVTARPCWPSEFDGSRRALAGLKDLTSRLIGQFCAAAQEATRLAYGPGPLIRYDADLVVPRDTLLEVAVLKGVTAHYVMAAEGRAAVMSDQRDLLTDLVDRIGRDPAAGLSAMFTRDWEQAADDAARLRVVVDQVASLTDRSAVALHGRLERRDG